MRAQPFPTLCHNVELYRIGLIQSPRIQKQYRLLAVPFWIAERAREPKTHSAARLERGEINEKRLGGSGKERDCALKGTLSRSDMRRVSTDSLGRCVDKKNIFFLSYLYKLLRLGRHLKAKRM